MDLKCIKSVISGIKDNPNFPKLLSFTPKSLVQFSPDLTTGNFLTTNNKRMSSGKTPIEVPAGKTVHFTISDSSNIKISHLWYDETSANSTTVNKDTSFNVMYGSANSSKWYKETFDFENLYSVKNITDTPKFIVVGFKKVVDDIETDCLIEDYDLFYSIE